MLKLCKIMQEGSQNLERLLKIIGSTTSLSFQLTFQPYNIAQLESGNILRHQFGV